MNLKIYSVVKSPNTFKPKVTNRLQNMFSSSKNDGVDLINVAQLNNYVKHLIFNIEDSLYSGTKKNGISKEIPFNQTINVFVTDDFIYIENKGKGYIDNIKEELEDKYKFTLQAMVISNSFFTKTKNKLKIRVSDVYFVDTFGDKIGEIEMLDEYKITNLPSDVLIRNITIQPLDIAEGYVTFYNDGRMNISFGSIEDFNKWLMFLDKELLNA